MLAGVTVALWPVFLIQTFKYTDSHLFYTVLLLWSVLLFNRGVLKDKWLSIILSGGLLGFATLTDSIALFIPIVFLFWAINKRPSVRTLGFCFVFLVSSSQ